MARTARIVIAGLPHHVTQRGNRRQQVFFSDEDRAMYLQTLKEESDKWGLKIMVTHNLIQALPGSFK